MGEVKRRAPIMGLAGIGLAGMLAACTVQPPPFEEVDDPFATNTLPPAASVDTQPLPSGNVASPIEESTSGDTVTFANEGGLVERLPNTCKLENYQQYAGQPGSVAQAAVTDRPARVIAPGAIVTQEYNPARVNFYVDGGGTIQRIICG